MGQREGGNLRLQHVRVLEDWRIDMNKFNEAAAPFNVDAAADADRTATLSEVAERLRDCLEELDRLQVWRVGAHVSQAISDLEVEICNSL
jgi:hypothetical protein